MEQQTVTIAKAGIHATLNARCSVLAAANPVYGQYNKNKKPQENIGLPDSLLSRFDLLFVVLDKLDRGADRNISDHVLRMHRYTKAGQEGQPLSFEVSSTDHMALLNESRDAANSDSSADSIFQKYDPLLHGGQSSASHAGSGNGILTLDFLKKYIYYAKTRFQPVLTDSAIDLIAEGYAELRSQQTARTLPVTARSLETLIRLASAHAKARLSKSIETVDAEKAMSLMSFALYHDTAESHGSSSAIGAEPTAPHQFSPVAEPMDDAEPTADELPRTPVKSTAVSSPSRKRDRQTWRYVTRLDEWISPRATKERPMADYCVFCSADELSHQVTQVLADMSAGDADQSFPLTDVLRRVNESRGPRDARVTQDELESVLLQLEVENKLMFVRDGDDPVVMLV
ncbi:hypothetical protein PINS_up014454 [Pythium insidiosum]|nr:hypothetical protein PINS_up014454 [Pythium insidiosum]